MKSLLLALFITGSLFGQSYSSSNRTQEGPTNYAGSDTGTANSYVITNPKPIDSYSEGNTYGFKATHQNTGAPTLNIDGKGAKEIKQYDGTTLAAAAIKVNDIVRVTYDGTLFRMPPTGSGTSTGNSNILFSSDLSGTATCSASDQKVAEKIIPANTITAGAMIKVEGLLGSNGQTNSSGSGQYFAVHIANGAMPSGYAGNYIFPSGGGTRYVFMRTFTFMSSPESSFFEFMNYNGAYYTYPQDADSGLTGIYAANIDITQATPVQVYLHSCNIGDPGTAFVRMHVTVTK